MTHDLELVTARWQRRNADQVFRFLVGPGFTVGEMLPGTIVYERLQLAIALQRVWHAFRGEAGRLLGFVRRRGAA